MTTTSPGLDERVREWLRNAREDKPGVATVLPPKYGMKGMYYTMPSSVPADREGGRPLMGVDPESASEPVEVVFSRAEKPYKNRWALTEALDVDVRLTPLVVAKIVAANEEVRNVRIPLSQNAWGRNVVMPVF